jgi:DNA-binding NarL/FixJ family response regulator
MSKILVIEDQPQMRKNLTIILQMEQFEVVSTDNGRQGIELAKSEKPDLVLCDVMMPELDGFGVVEHLRNDPDMVTLPVIFLTAKGDKTDVRAGMNLGVDDYLIKPVAREDLLTAVRVRLARRQTHQAEIESAKSAGGFRPIFDSAEPLSALGLTGREAQVLLWVAQGKSNGDIAIILGMAEKTVKKHMTNIFNKLGVEGRNAATIRALEVLSSPQPTKTGKQKGIGI